MAEMGGDLRRAVLRIVVFVRSKEGYRDAGSRGTHQRTMVEFVFTITQGRSGTKSLAELFTQHDGAALSVHERVDANAHGLVTPDIGHMRRFNSHGLTGEIANFWKRKLAMVREDTVKRGLKRYVETAHMNAKCGLVEYVLAAATNHDGDRFRFIVLNRALDKIARSMHERHDMRQIENMWLWYLDPAYARNIVDAMPYSGHGYLGLLTWYVREVEARKARYKSSLSGKFDVLTIDIHQPDWIEIVSQGYGLNVPSGAAPIIANQNKTGDRRSALELHVRNLLAAIPLSTGTDKLSDSVRHAAFRRWIEDLNRERAVAEDADILRGPGSGVGIGRGAFDEARR
jgi:hypothetical protein